MDSESYCKQLNPISIRYVFEPNESSQTSSKSYTSQAEPSRDQILNQAGSNLPLFEKKNGTDPASSRHTHPSPAEKNLTKMSLPSFS